MEKATVTCVIAFAFLFGSIQAGFPHCDTMDGPVVSDAKKAFEHGAAYPPVPGARMAGSAHPPVQAATIS